MEVKAKFKPGQTVYFIRNNGVCEGVVDSVYISVKRNLDTDIKYVVGNFHNMEEDILFSTKKELLESL
jgi:hypothetical protein